MAALSIEFVLAVAARVEGHERLRPLARQIDATIASDAVLYAFDPDSQPAFFYLSRPPRYVARAAELPDDARFLFVPEEFLPRLREGGRWDVAEERIRYVDRGGRDDDGIKDVVHNWSRMISKTAVLSITPDKVSLPWPIPKASTSLVAPTAVSE